MAYQPTNGDLKRLYASIGFKIKSENDGVEIDETVIGSKPAIYLKFMSDGGTKDDANGMALKALLDANCISYESSRARSVIMADTDFIKLFGKNAKQTSTPTNFETNFKRLVETVSSGGIDSFDTATVKQFRALLDMNSPDASQFYNDLLATAETRARMEKTLARMIKKFK
jgi:hypothetical protein